MAVSIPDTLTVNSSERYILSIRISPDGFSFSGTIPSKSDSFFYRQITFDRSKDYATLLKEAFFAEECLTWAYKAVNIFCFTSNYLFVPETFYDEDKKHELMQYAFLSPTQKCLSDTLDSGQGKTLFGIDQDVYEFLVRSFVNPKFIHHMTLPFGIWKQQSDLSFSNQMYVILNKKTIDIACFKRGEPVFFNAFEYTNSDDILYFILCAWRQTGLDQLKDKLYIFGETDSKKLLITSLQNYIHYVSEMELPADVYLRNKEILQAPYDIILSVCE